MLNRSAVCFVLVLVLVATPAIADGVSAARQIKSALESMRIDQALATWEMEEDSILDSLDGAFIAGTRPGRKVADVFGDGIAAYERAGYPEEWRKHHQGGPTGYQGRSYKGRPGVSGEVLEAQAYAWNPSITGTKSEDTIVATSAGPEIISPPAGWPLIEVDAGGIRLERPDILVR